MRAWRNDVAHAEKTRPGCSRRGRTRSSTTLAPAAVEKRAITALGQQAVSMMILATLALRKTQLCRWSLPSRTVNDEVRAGDQHPGGPRWCQVTGFRWKGAVELSGSCRHPESKRLSESNVGDRATRRTGQSPASLGTRLMVICDLSRLCAHQSGRPTGAECGELGERRRRCASDSLHRTRLLACRAQQLSVRNRAGVQSTQQRGSSDDSVFLSILRQRSRKPRSRPCARSSARPARWSPTLRPRWHTSPVLIQSFLHIFDKVHGGSFSEQQIRTVLLTDA